MPPRPFGRYEVVARLAVGGAANIFLAREPITEGHRLVCVKTLLPERARDAEFVAMFLDEARLAQRLEHPNCVEIYDVGRQRGVFYMSMEYIFGETLWNLLATVAEVRRPLPQAVVASILYSACSGLHHAHDLEGPDGRPYNLVHRDVSPQNIMVTFDGVTKVLDFGVAKAETGRQATATGIVKGKFSYMSPEQITGGAVDRRSDVFSLGIVMFECLASRRLYRAESPEDIAALMLDRRPPRLREIVADIHPTLDAICSRALSRHADNRYPTAAAMADALADYLAEIRFDTSYKPVRRLVAERFAADIDRRRRLFGGVEAGAYDETELITALGARPVFEVDLFPNLNDTDGRMTAPPKLPFTPEAMEEAPTALDLQDTKKRRGREGWQVRLGSTEDAIDSDAIGVPDVPAMTGTADESEAETRFEHDGTHVDPDADGTDAVSVNQDQHETLDGSAGLRQEIDAVRATEQAPVFPDPGDTLDDAASSTDLRMPLVQPVQDTDETLDEPPAGRLSSERGEIFRFKVGATPGDSDPAWNDTDDVQPVEPSPLPHVREPGTQVSSIPPSPRPSKPAWSEPAPPATRVRTYTLGVVLTAFAAGLALGLLIGLLVDLV